MIEDIQSIIEEENIVEDAGNTVTTQIGSSGTLELQQTNVVRFQNQVESIIIDIKDINKIRSICENAKDIKPAWSDVFLGAASLFSGAVFSAIVSGISIEANWQCILFYIVFPSLAVGSIVAYVFMRIQIQLSIKSMAISLLELLPDSNEMGKEQGDNDES